MRKILGGIGILLSLASACAAAGDETFFRFAGGRAGVLGDNNSGSGWYGNFFAGTRGVIGLSHSHLWLDQGDFAPTSNVANLKETALLVGWGDPTAVVAFGPSRVQIDGSRCRRDFEGADHCVMLGLAAELHLDLALGPVGIQLRAFGNLNTADKFSGVGIGLSFGADPQRVVRVQQPVVEETPGMPPASPPARPAGPEPAPGKSAKLRPEAQARVRPQVGADGSIPAGATVTIKSSLSNNEGTWWYVEAAGKSGWARAEDLDVVP